MTDDERAWCNKSSEAWTISDELAYNNLHLWAATRIKNGKIDIYDAATTARRIQLYRDGKSIQEIDAATPSERGKAND